MNVALIPALLLLSSCASYEVNCTPDGGKSVQIRSTRAVTGVAAQITPECGITAAVDQATGAAEVIERIGSAVEVPGDDR